MIPKLAGYGKVTATLLMIELLLPGGTLVALAFLLSGRLSPAMSPRRAPLFPSWIKDAAGNRTLQSQGGRVS